MIKLDVNDRISTQYSIPLENRERWIEKTLNWGARLDTGEPFYSSVVTTN